MGKIDIKVFRKFANIEKYLFKAKNREELFRRITKEATSLLDVDTASIYSLDDKDIMLIGETGYGKNESVVKKIRVPLSFSKTALEAYKTKKPVMIIDVKKEGKIPEEFVRKYDIRSSLILPLIGLKRKVLGFLFLDVVGRTKKFSPEERILAECFANLAAIAIEQTKLREKLERKIDILSAYSDITSAALHPLNIKNVMKQSLARSTKAMKMQGGSIHLIEDGKLVLMSQVNIPKNFADKFAKIEIGQYLVGKVAKTQKLIIVEDSTIDPKASKEVVRMTGYHSLISVPLMAEDKVVGVLTLASSEKKRFTKEEIDYFNNVGRQIGVMIENAMLFERMDISNKRIKALVELSQSLVSILDISLLYKKVLSELPSIVPCFFASIFLIEQKRRELVIADSVGRKKHLWKDIRIKIGKGITGRVAKTGKSDIVSDIRKRKNYIGNLKRIRSEVAVPLSVKGQIIGVLDIESKKINAFTEDDLEILTAIANVLAIAIENARLYQESKERTAQLELINRVIKEMGKAQEIDTLSQRLCEVIQGHFYYDHTHLFLLDEERKNVVLKGYAGYSYEVNVFHQSIERGLLGLCVRSRKSVLENNTRKNKNFVWQLPEEEKPLSEMDIPLIFGNKLFGVLSLQSKTQDAFSEWDIVAMETISEHIASSLNNAKLYSDLSHRISELSTVYEIGVDLSVSRNLDELLEKMYKRTSSMTGARTFYVALYNKKNDTVRFEIDYEEGIKGPQETIRLSDMAGYTGWILRNNAPILIKDFKTDIEKYPVEPILDGLKMKSYLGIPIRFKDKAIGVLSLQSRKPNLFD